MSETIRSPEEIAKGLDSFIEYAEATNKIQDMTFYRDVKQRLQELQAENEALQEENRKLRTDTVTADWYLESEKKVEALQAENEALQKNRDEFREAVITGQCHCPKSLGGSASHFPGCTGAREEKIAALQAENEALQAKVDSLMLEYCPDEMTPEQVETWGKHQQHTEQETEQ